MAKIEKNSAGLYVGPDNTLAVSMQRRASRLLPDGYARLDFRGTPLSEITRIEWPATVAGADNSIALVPASLAGVLIASRYARYPLEAEVAAWNAAHGETLDDGAGPVGAGEGAPEPQATTAPAEPQPAAQETRIVEPVVEPEPEVSIGLPGASPTQSPSKASLPPAPNGDHRKGGKRK